VFIPITNGRSFEKPNVSANGLTTKSSSDGLKNSFSESPHALISINDNRMHAEKHSFCIFTLSMHGDIVLFAKVQRFNKLSKHFLQKEVTSSRMFRG